MNKFTAVVAMLAALPLSAVLADRPSGDAKPLVEVVEQLERKGYGPFIEVSFDDGYWEVEVYLKDAPYELAVDRTTGEILSQHADDAEPRPPHDAQPLSRILRSLIKAGYVHIDEVSFERRYWEVEAVRAGVRREVHVHPTTGAIINDRIDD